MDLLQKVTLMGATITMGIAAGVYLLYAFVIMPGLAKTDDRTFVGAFQQIDKAIVGPFLLVFFVGPLALSTLAAATHLGNGNRTTPVLIVGAVVLQLVMAGITLSVNVPLNNDIKAAGNVNEIDDVAAVRTQFNEPRWVRWNSVRTMIAIIAFGLLSWALVLAGGTWL
ncbi:MAG: DUF1772 domain-containing protein [Actinomycetota bacterium]|nr:DUF1772 domain-containing protein [Actinomycetota bacterium]